MVSYHAFPFPTGSLFFLFFPRMLLTRMSDGPRNDSRRSLAWFTRSPNTLLPHQSLDVYTGCYPLENSSSDLDRHSTYQDAVRSIPSRVSSICSLHPEEDRITAINCPQGNEKSSTRFSTGEHPLVNQYRLNNSHCNLKTVSWWRVVQFITASDGLTYYSIVSTVIIYRDCELFNTVWNE